MAADTGGLEVAYGEPIVCVRSGFRAGTSGRDFGVNLSILVAQPA